MSSICWRQDQAVILTSLDKPSFCRYRCVNNVEEGKLDEMGYRSIKVSMRLQWNHNELNLLDDFAYSHYKVRDLIALKGHLREYGQGKELR